MRSMWKDSRMAVTTVRGVRLDPGDIERVYEARPELVGVELSRVLRIGLAVLAGHPVDEAIRLTPRRKSGPAPRADRERTGAAA
jgi:hypothetical protein